VGRAGSVDPSVVGVPGVLVCDGVSALWRAYQLKESLRAVFAGDLDRTDTSVMLDRWCSKAQRSRIPEFVKTARTIRKHRDGIDAAIDRGLLDGRQEGLHNKVHLIIRRAYGFHSPEAALATVMLVCRPVNLKLSYHTPATHM
jgi:transposase